MVRVFTLCPKPIGACTALWAGLTAAAWAQSPDTLDQTSEQIEALRAEITVIQARLASQENERDALQDALREAEVQIGDLDRQLSALSQERRALQNEMQRKTAKKSFSNGEVLNKATGYGLWRTHVAVGPVSGTSVCSGEIIVRTQASVAPRRPSPD